ncbi:MAG: hypothetical protein E7J62_18150 [Serratia marcescens]|uniref:hypothetical protein n=1 Tax=Serratia marcescens TaxID=615 RepID=UPI002911EADF|nr:hypothetical protein [Serratia marcescens]
MACDIERIKRHALPAGECPRQSQVVLLSSLQRLLTSEPAAPAVPDGFKLVPSVPTPEMISAAMNCDDVTFINLEDFCVNFGNIYAAMLAAAPEGVK